MKKQRYSIFVFYFLMLYHALVLAQGECLITEIIYALPGSDSPNEYVELFNPSEMDTLDLNGWSIRDRSSTDALIDSGYGLKVPPLSYAVILEGDYPVNSGIYLGLIPENTILVKVDDSSIGNGLSSSDSLYILDSADQVIETLGWEDWSD
ncbi:MAG TPA: lamin tail domain-containing protein, partial [Candidatus Marinimicrobia bacterium]|nr:lamin tail domain-containing protein [Candidatus Neomarinimicrobiota bacterium]